MSRQLTLPSPPVWSNDQIERDVAQARALFRQERLEEPVEAYVEAFDAIRGSVEKLLADTGDLAQWDEKALQILSDPAMLIGVRYLAGPPISQDDLRTLVDAVSLSPSYLRQTPELVDLIVNTILTGLDRRRFPWVAEGRAPTESERHAAIIASAALIAAQRVATKRRSEGKSAQEELVREQLVALGFQEIVVPKMTIQTIANAPRPGEFCREVLLGNKKADLVIGLWGNLTVAIECKVSNSSVNSFKRLNHEAVGKAKEWVAEFGRRNVFPVAVLGGVFNPRNVHLAQDAGLTIIWGHRLVDLIAWIIAIRAASERA